MFHDESTQVVDKASGRTSSNSGKPNGSHNKPTKTSPKRPPPVNIVDSAVSQSLDDFGVNFFMSNLVADVSILFYIPSFYVKKGYAHHGLHQSITATGLASYAKVSGRKEVVEYASKSYNDAVRGINAALSNPKTASQDSTLVCIVLAAMFELLIVPQKAGLDSCSKHMGGAVTVALLHMKQERRSEVTIRILLTLVQSFILCCWLNNRPLPPRFTEMMDNTGVKLHHISLHSTFLGIVKNFIDFRLVIQNGTAGDPTYVIRQAEGIIFSLEEFLSSMPQYARFDSFRISSSAVEHLAYTGYYHSMPLHIDTSVKVS